MRLQITGPRRLHFCLHQRTKSLRKNLLIRLCEQLRLESTDFTLADHAPIGGNGDLWVIHDLDLELGSPRKEMYE